MAKKAYVGVSNKARSVKSIYVGVNGVARKVKKAYVGVGNIAKLFYEGIKPDEEIPFVTSRSWTVPSGCTSIDIFCVGGGGGAGGSYRWVTETFTESGIWSEHDCYRYGASGGGGYTSTALNVAVTAGETLSIEVGDGGEGGKSYNNYNGTNYGEVTSANAVTAGKAGGTSCVKRGSILIHSSATAAGGAGGSACGYKSTSRDTAGCNGANGGNASGAGGSVSHNYYQNSQGIMTQDDGYAIINHSSYLTGQYYGDGGTGGGNGNSVDKWSYNNISGSESRTSQNVNTGGTGQGRNTRKYGNASDPTEFSNIGYYSANSGNSGPFDFDISLSDQSDKEGSSGIVIIKCHYT